MWCVYVANGYRDVGRGCKPILAIYNGIPGLKDLVLHLGTSLETESFGFTRENIKIWEKK